MRVTPEQFRCQTTGRAAANAITLVNKQCIASSLKEIPTDPPDILASTLLVGNALAITHAVTRLGKLSIKDNDFSRVEGRDQR